MEEGLKFTLKHKESGGQELYKESGGQESIIAGSSKSMYEESGGQELYKESGGQEIKKGKYVKCGGKGKHKKEALPSDQVGPPPPKCRKVDDSTSTRLVILVRHGEYEKKHSPDAQYLTPKGVKQARCTAKAIKKMPNRPTVFQVVCSSLIRAQETAVIIHSPLFDNTRFAVDGLLNEGHLTDPSALERFNKAYQKYLVVPMAGHAKTEVVVCHGNIIRYFISRILKTTPDELQLPPHCSVTVVRISSSGKQTLICYGSFTHLYSLATSMHI